jgi:hypothetical protein
MKGRVCLKDLLILTMRPFPATQLNRGIARPAEYEGYPMKTVLIGGAIGLATAELIGAFLGYYSWTPATGADGLPVELASLLSALFLAPVGLVAGLIVGGFIAETFPKKPGRQRSPEE